MESNRKKYSILLNVVTTVDKGPMSDSGAKFGLGAERTEPYSAPGADSPRSEESGFTPTESCSAFHTVQSSSTLDWLPLLPPSLCLSGCGRKHRHGRLHSYSCPCQTIILCLSLGFSLGFSSPNSHSYHSLTWPFLSRYPSGFCPKGLSHQMCFTFWSFLPPAAPCLATCQGM